MLLLLFIFVVIAGREKTAIVNVPPAVLLCCTALCTMAQMQNIAVSPLSESDLTGISTTNLNEPDEQNNRGERNYISEPCLRA